MKILQLPQGYYGDLTGMPEIEAMGMLVADELTRNGIAAAVAVTGWYWLMWQLWGVFIRAHLTP